MYFLAHMYTILKAIPENFEQKLLEPLIVGCWSPDAGYFPLFSWKMRLFKHTDSPPINFYRNLEAEAFKLGWKAHIACDELIHEKLFYENNEPLCSPIVTNEGFWRYLITSREHLGKEVGLDLFIYENLLTEEEWIKRKISNESTYMNPKISFQGYRMLQKYIYCYTNWFLPMMANKIIGSGVIKNIIDYKIYLKENFKTKIITFLEDAQKTCKKMQFEKIATQK